MKVKKKAVCNPRCRNAEGIQKIVDVLMVVNVKIKGKSMEVVCLIQGEDGEMLAGGDRRMLACFFTSVSSYLKNCALTALPPPKAQ